MRGCLISMSILLKSQTRHGLLLWEKVYLQVCMEMYGIKGHSLPSNILTFFAPKVNCGLPNPAWLGVSSALGIYPDLGLILHNQFLFLRFTVCSTSSINCWASQARIAASARSKWQTRHYKQIEKAGFGARSTVDFWF